MVLILGLFLLNRNGVLEIPLAVDSSDTPRWPQLVGSVARPGRRRWAVLLQHLMLLHSLSMIGPPPSSLLAAAERKPPIYRLLGLRGLRVAVHHETLLPALVEHVGLVLEVVDEPEAVGLPGGLLVHGEELLLRQQGAELLQHRLQLQLVAQAPYADKLHVDADRRADQPQLLRRDPGADLHVASSDEQRVQSAVPGLPVQFRLVGVVIHHDQHLI